MVDNDDIQEATRRIKEAIETGETKLSLKDLKGVTSLSDLDVDIAAATTVTHLNLGGTQITDITPIAGLTGITALYLGNTQITDIVPIAGMTGITTLTLRNTQITDLRPLQSLAGLRDNPSVLGLSFEGCKACELDPRIAEIAEIENRAERAWTLFDYLKDWVPPGGDPSEILQLPEGRPAPLKTTIISNRLVLSPPKSLPEADAQDRAEMGWEALKDFREGFGQSFAFDNYAPLPSVLAAFDRAMGDRFDTRRQIAMGMHGERLIQLSGDANFLENLPTGAVSELQSFAAAIGTFVNRFPDWIAYQEDAKNSLSVVDIMRDEKEALDALAAALAENPQVDDAVTAEFSTEINDATSPSSDEVTAHGTLASTRETILKISENALIELKNGNITRDHAAAMAKTGSSEIAKVKYWTYGWSIHLLYVAAPSLRKLSGRLPWELRWVERVLDKIRADD
jgi:Leucine-rich repeat (LRR) protein